MHLEDLIRHRLASGIPVQDPERYEAEFRTIRALRQPSTTSVELADGRTILMTNTPLPMAAGLASMKTSPSVSGSRPR